jgi:hypothetical protein
MKKKKQKFQLNLDTFLGIKAKIKQFFYIDWTKSSNNEIPIAEWLEEKPKEVTWSQIIKWKNVGDILVCCTDNKSFSESDSNNINIETQLRLINRKSWDEKKSLMNFLKSHLQKCFRRKKNIEALRSSYEMMLININELLRRVCIIIFEDVRLKNYFPTMVWLMAAVSKGYQLQSYHINLELKFINDLCLDDGYNDLSELTKYDNHFQKVDVRNLLLEIESNDLLTKEQKSLIYSIGLRIGFGGREGDMQMIFDYSLIWYNKFKLNLKEKNPENEVQALDLIKSEFVCIEFCQNNRFKKLEDFVYQGVDMNSYFKIVPEIYEEIEHHYSLEEIENTIWFMSSGLNVRKPPLYDQKMKFCWEEIKDLLKRKQIVFLKYILSKLII